MHDIGPAGNGGDIFQCSELAGAVVVVIGDVEGVVVEGVDVVWGAD